ncbi:hypothetical protein [Halobellus captivus]|uniref:hypothetical protein n=1 Tax=Halobellus captivus TaxID=2592614 RepID=UPI0011A61046|nr:hypothetical protein [Halobellus captivus]
MDTIDTVRAALDSDRRASFARRVEREAEALQTAVRDGAFDATEFAVGMELEGYVVDSRGRLADAPEGLFETDGCSRELGVHNAELHTEPDVVCDAGIRRQFEELRSVHGSVQGILGEADRRFVLDAMWTVPPVSGTRRYLEGGRDVDGVFLPDNMRPVPRYIALNQVIRAGADGRIDLGLPGLESTDSMLVESLATSMQPHLQIPDPADVPRYLNVATRTMGPVLSLSANSPFLPADLYAEALGKGGVRIDDLLGDAPHEHRIPIFERSVDEGSNKCRIPSDVETVDDLIARIAADPTLVAAPDLDDETDAASGRYDAFGAKRGTYWRWVRPVFGGEVPRASDGDPVPGGDEESIRIEYRPLPTQPTLRDTVGVQALVVGVLRGVDVSGHPLATLPWEEARRSFYAAVDEGPDAELRWVTSDGERTTATGLIYDELFSLARRGLDDLGVGTETIEWALGPIEARRETAHTAPSAWKRAAVRDAVDDGASVADAIREMQSTYVERAASGTPFSRW